MDTSICHSASRREHGPAPRIISDRRDQSGAKERFHNRSAVGQGPRLPVWVKLRRTQCEQRSSGLPLKADIAQYSRHVSKVPKHKVAALQPAARGQEPRGRKPAERTALAGLRAPALSRRLVNLTQAGGPMTDTTTAPPPRPP